MNIDELLFVAEWLGNHSLKLQRLYKDVQKVFQHNSNQPQKQPVADELQELTEYLEYKTDLSQLSKEELSIVELFGVLQLIGKNGLQTVDSWISTSSFDPATAQRDFESAVQSLAAAHDRCEKITQALDVLPSFELNEEELDRMHIRVEFQHQASVENTPDLKRWASKLNDIARGITLAVGEKPQDVHIYDATRGSLILTLSTTLVAAMMIGKILKIITERADAVVQLLNNAENLKQNKLLTAEMATAHQKAADEIESSVVEDVTEAISEDLGQPGEDYDAAALTKSIKTLYELKKKGGGVDFLNPARLTQMEQEEPEVDEDGNIVEDDPEKIELRNRLMEYQSDINQIRNSEENIKLLQILKEDEDEDEDKDEEDT